MKFIWPTCDGIFLFFIFFLLFCSEFLRFAVSDQACKNSCGNLQVRYPFGTGPGCGDPRFQTFVTCVYNSEQDRQQLVLATHTGKYAVQWIDYSNQVIYIQDPTMSTCSCMQPSKGFGLDWNAPFTFLDRTVFALLGCSAISSPVFNNSFSFDFKKSNAPLCDVSGTPICSQLYSCPAVSGLNLPLYSPASSCCIYSPVDLGPSFDMDLTKLECASYTSILNFDYQQLDVARWKFGIGLKYRFSVNNAYPLACMQCEKSNGVCGYAGSYNSFVCNCPAGMNTTTDCLFEASYWSQALNNLPSIWTGILCLLFGLVMLMD